MTDYEEVIVFQKSYTTPSNIAVGATDGEGSIEQSDIDKHGYFNRILIVNSGVQLALRFEDNPDNEFPVAASGSSGGDVLPFTRWTYVNKDSATEHTAGTVSILVQKVVKRKINFEVV